MKFSHMWRKIHGEFYERSSSLWTEMVLARHKDTFTAPVFRSKPEIAVGFLRGGFWKYNAKPSNILALDEEIICGCRTRFCCRFGADGNPSKASLSFGG
ncbi:unnamed protein product [Prunus armeniaca]|uniref:Uncharacterized protein n=1 Tax=Prunus armeniaca TaxID=36596 RepID=A0A6J5VEU9_PRUAR|nr:unnamed protein product [Prunus armeniaca]